MGTRSFTVKELLMKSRLKLGDAHASNCLHSDMLTHKFDVTRPYFVTHDEKRHVYVVSQDYEDGEEVEDAEDDFQRHGERAISWGAEDDLSV
jgi:hypothetical protein